MALTPPSPAVRRSARAAAWLWAGAILVACLWPGNELPEVDVPLADKWVHFVLFGVLSFLQGLASPSRWRLALLTGVLFGIAVEGLQLLTHAWLHRNGDVSDVVADALGTLLGLAALVAARRLFRKPLAG